MHLPDYIRTIGDSAAMVLFGVKPGTVKAWRLGYRVPAIEKAREIEAVTGGKVSFSECYPPKVEAA